MLTDYYRVLLDRVKALGYDTPSEEALEALQSQVALLKEDKSSVKPIIRTSPEGLSLFRLGGIRSIKVGEGPLGKGKAGRTYLHVDAEPGDDKLHHYAVKVFSYDFGSKEIAMPLEVAREIAVLKRHNRFIRYDYRINQNKKIKFYVVGDYIPGKTLKGALDELGRKQPLTLERALLLMRKLTECIKSFHETGDAHGDLKPDNVMLDDLMSANPMFTLIDFNHSLQNWESEYYSPPLVQGMHRQIAPECCGVSDVFYNPATDIYALGDIFRLILEKTSYFPQKLTKCSEFICRMRSEDPSLRPTINEIISFASTSMNDVLRERKRLEASNKNKDMLMVSAQVKISAINELARYNQSIRAVGSYVGNMLLRYFGLDVDYDQKSVYFEKLIAELEVCFDRDLFYQCLQKALCDYIIQFTTKEMEHYCQLPDLGAGLSCFISAFSVLGSEFNHQELASELAHVLSPDYEYGDFFVRKFMRLLQNKISINATTRGNYSVK